MKRAFAALSLAALCSLGCGMFGADEATVRLQVQLEESQKTIADLNARLATCSCPEPAVAVAEPAPVKAASPVDLGNPNEPGEIEVKASTAVQVLIDGKVVVYNPIKSAYIKRDLTAGPHLIEVETPGVRQVNWSDTVEVPGGKRLRFQHKLGQKGLMVLVTRKFAVLQSLLFASTVPSWAR